MAENLGGKPEPDDGSADPFGREFDEEFVKQAGAKEPSARARELTAKWAKEAPKPTVWRGDAPVSPPTPSPAPPPSSAPRRAPRPTATDWPKPCKKRVWPRNAAIAIVAAGVVGFLAYPRHHTQTPVNGTPAGTDQPWTAAPSPTPSPTYAHPDDQYFVGTPSLLWADNDAGIVAPKAHSIGQFSATEVAAGYQGLRQLLAAGDLDATILNAGPTTDFTRLIDTRSTLGTDLKSWIAHPGYNTDPIGLITRFNPATTRLLGHTVKVSGTMSAAIDPSGYLSVSGDYRFVYAVGPANGNGLPSRVIVHRMYKLELATPGQFDAQTGRYWISDYNSEIANSACFQYNGFINPTFGNADNSPRSGKTVDPYASGQPLAEAPSSSPVPTASAGECDSVSRT